MVIRIRIINNCKGINPETVEKPTDRLELIALVLKIKTGMIQDGTYYLFRSLKYKRDRAHENKAKTKRNRKRN